MWGRFTVIFLAAFFFAAAARSENFSSILGDVDVPPSDISQKYPFGMTWRTPPPIFKIDKSVRAMRYMPRVRMFQQVPSIEISNGGRLWAAYMCSNVTVARDPYHYEQYIIVATSADGGRTWREVYAIDPLAEGSGTASDSILWKDSRGTIRLAFIRNFDVYAERDKIVAASWEISMSDPESEDCKWGKPRLIGRVNVCPQKPLNMGDGTILRPVDNFWNFKDPDRIRFMRETLDGKVLFISSLRCDGASFAESSPIRLPDSSIQAQVRMPNSTQSIYNSADGGKTWKFSGMMNPPVAISTRCCFYNLKSGRILLVANDVGADSKDWKIRRSKLTAFMSDDGGKSYPHKLLLDERPQATYPSIAQGADGSIYVAYDRGRQDPNAQEILFAKFTEADVLAGKIVSKDSKLKRTICRLSDFGGGVCESDRLEKVVEPNW